MDQKEKSRSPEKRGDKLGIQDSKSPQPRLKEETMDDDVLREPHRSITHSQEEVIKALKGSASTKSENRDIKNGPDLPNDDKSLF